MKKTLLTCCYTVQYVGLLVAVLLLMMCSANVMWTATVAEDLLTYKGIV